MMATQKKTRIKEHTTTTAHSLPTITHQRTSTPHQQLHLNTTPRYPGPLIQDYLIDSPSPVFPAPLNNNLNPKDSSTRPGCYLPLPPSPCPSQTAGTIRRNTPKSTAMSWSTSSRYTSFQYTSSLVQKGLSILQL